MCVQDGVWSKRIETSPDLFNLTGSAASSLGTTTAAPTLPLRFDVGITAASSLRIQNNVANMVASADLQLACCNGKHLKSAKLIVRKAGVKALDYIIIELSECMVTAVTTGGSGGEDRLTENVTLNFSKIHFEYKVQDEKGGGKDGGQYTWDVAGNDKG